MKRRIHAYGKDLLGSVLMRVLSAWRLAEKLDAEFVCHWPPDTHLRRDFHFAELFEGAPPFTLSTGQPDMRDVPSMVNAMDGWNLDPDKLPQEFFYSPTGITLLPGETLDAAQAEARALMARLTPARAVCEAISEIEARAPLGDAMAVHVRRGTDIVPPLLRGNLAAEEEAVLIRGFVRAYIDLESYRCAVRALGSPPCFIFCHDDAVRAEIKGDLGGHTVDDFPAIQKLTPLRQDFAEILVMSRTARLLGVKSNYSGLARLLGDLKVVSVAKWLSPENMFELILETFAQRLDLQMRVLQESARWYGRTEPAASAYFAEAAYNLKARLALTA